MGKTIKTYAMCTVIYAETDAEAEALVEHYRDGVDMGAVIEMLKSWGVPPERLTDVAGQPGRLHDPDRGGLARHLRRTDRRISQPLRDGRPDADLPRLCGGAEDVRRGDHAEIERGARMNAIDAERRRGDLPNGSRPIARRW